MSKQIHDERQRKKQVKVRVDADLVEEFDEWCDDRDTNRSEAIRQHMRAAVSGGQDYETPRQPPGDDDRLATAYKRLCAVANGDGVVRENTATSVLATVLGISKAEIKPMAIKPLRKRGYLRTQSNIYGDTSYHIAGWKN
mgnify:CR=1 FL=1